MNIMNSKRLRKGTGYRKDRRSKSRLQSKIFIPARKIAIQFLADLKTVERETRNSNVRKILIGIQFCVVRDQACRFFKNRRILEVTSGQ